MREKGAIPYAYTADLGQYDEPDLAGVPERAQDYGAELARLVDCRTELVHEGLVALQCGAFHISTAGKTYFNTTPLGRAVTGTLLVQAMQDDGVDIWGDGSTYKGNDIERFYRYGLLVNRPAHLQAVARRGLRRRARRPGRDERVANAAASRTATARRRPTRPTPTSGAPPTRPSGSRARRRHGPGRADHGCAALGRDVAIEPETVTVAFHEGWPVAINGDEFGRPVELSLQANRRRPPRTRDQ